MIDPHNCLLMTLDGRILRGLFEHKEVKTHLHKNESMKYPEFNPIKTDYECRSYISFKFKRQLTYHLKIININFKFCHLVL